MNGTRPRPASKSQNFGLSSFRIFKSFIMTKAWFGAKGKCVQHKIIQYRFPFDEEREGALYQLQSQAGYEVVAYYRGKLACGCACTHTHVLNLIQESFDTAQVGVVRYSICVHSYLKSHFISQSKAEKSNTSAKCLLGITDKLMAFMSDSQSHKPFRCIFKLIWLFCFVLRQPQLK